MAKKTQCGRADLCGIAGLMDRRLSSEKIDDTLRAMGSALRHRGPDADGIWCEPKAGLGFAHRRLSIIDISETGAQPMTSANGRYVITYNGEIYNFIEMRRELAAGGKSFSGTSDTEVMLAAIEAWGLTNAVSRFVGMFAFALWDRETRTLSLVRDRLGIKPLYWAAFGELFLFASELKALRACAGWQSEIDPNALTSYMRWNYIPGPQTIYQGVHKLEPGAILSFGPDRTLHIERYWDARQIVGDKIADRRSFSDSEAISELDRLLKRAVGSHMVADVPLGAFLSGGIDSSLVVALMQAQSTRPVKTFSIGFQDDAYDEAKYARRVAAHLGSDHTELYITPEHALEVIPKLPLIYDEPFADSSQLPTFLVSEMTRPHVTVALSGDGGDELFAGYTRYQWADAVWRRCRFLPLAVREMAAKFLRALPAATWSMAGGILPGHFGAGRLDDRVAKFAQYISQPDGNAIYRAQHSHWDPSVMLRGVEPKGCSWDTTLQQEFPNFIERMQFLDMVQYMPDDILTKVDRASMAVSLEVRVPLLDHRVVEFAWDLPENFKRRDGQAKWALRQVLDNYVPRELIDRPKMGFAAPVATWLRSSLRDWAEDLLDEHRLTTQGYFKAAMIRQHWHRFLEGDNSMREPLWGVLMFQAWHASQR